MTGPRRPPPRLTAAQRREMKAEFEKARANTPLEDHCCAELNDDGTLKLLKLLRAYVEAGVSEAEIRKALLGVAREHLREHQEWEEQYNGLHRRWRLFKNPETRPRNGQFWLACGAPDPREAPETRWRRVRLTDRDDQKDETPNPSLLVVTVRPILEQLEAATSDQWPATPEGRVVKHHEPRIPPRQLVDQAFHEYERTEEIRERQAAEKAAAKAAARRQGAG